jgi:hypothetical protein
MQKTAVRLEDRLRQNQPLIVLGMHRSGTSLAVRLLTSVGIHMGHQLSRDAEAVFFQKLNRRIFRSVDVKWGYVDPLIEAMETQSFVEEQTRIMLTELFTEKRLLGREIKISEFFGPQLWPEVKQNKLIYWGWKDPRTTITFPVWLKIFPNAKVLHLLRNGIDVAISTHRRSLKQQRNFLKRTLPLDYSPITLDFEYCFQLWQVYVSFVLENKPLISEGNYLEIRFEDLLSEPEQYLRSITEFVEYPVQEEKLNAAIEQVNQSRLDNSVLAAKYRQQIPSLASNTLMQQLGYSYFTEN